MNATHTLGLDRRSSSTFPWLDRQLGITQLLSIEKDVENETRFEFNRPFNCIRLDFRESSKVLPTIRWNKRTILWLDYDGKLSDSILADISYFFTLGSSGSVTLLSVQANPDRRFKRLKTLVERIESSKIPSGITEDTLEEWGTAATYFRIINNQIQESLARRNLILKPEKRLNYSQIFHFYYADGAKMLTVGGVLYAEDERQKFVACDFANQLEFVRTDTEPYRLFVPGLTIQNAQSVDTPSCRIRLRTSDQWASQEISWKPTEESIGTILALVKRNCGDPAGCPISPLLARRDDSSSTSVSPVVGIFKLLLFL